MEWEREKFIDGYDGSDIFWEGSMFGGIVDVKTRAQVVSGIGFGTRNSEALY